MNWLSQLKNPDPFRSLLESALDDFPDQASRGLAKIGDSSAVKSISAYLRQTTKRENVIQIFINLLTIPGGEADRFVDSFSGASRTTLPLAQRSPLSEANKTGFHIEATSKGADGVKVALVAWDGLGSPEDLWVVRWDSTAWTDPVFTGISKSVPRSYPGRFSEDEDKHSVEIMAYASSLIWTKVYNADSELQKDSDCDGLTDIVERWIGTDPSNSDTDSDGIPDGIDKNPMGRPATGDGLALKAALIPFTVFHAKTNQNLVVYLPKEVQPVEMESSQGNVYMYDNAKAATTHSRDLYRHLVSVSSAKSPSPQVRVFRIGDDFGSFIVFYEVTVVNKGGTWRIKTFTRSGSAVS